MTGAEVIWTDDKHGVWLCDKCGVARCYTRSTVEQAAADHVCMQSRTQYWHDDYCGNDGSWYRTVFADDRVLVHVYDNGWQSLDERAEFPIELCDAYWAPSQGGACDLPKGHEGNHHV